MKNKQRGASAAKGMAASAEKTGLHPRNPHRGRYDFRQLIACSMKNKQRGASAAKGMAASAEKTGLHPRNPHRGRYDFRQLVACSPELAAFVATNEYGDESIAFADPAAVKALNRALLKQKKMHPTIFRY